MKHTKLTKLLGVYQCFGSGCVLIPDPFAQKLSVLAAKVSATTLSLREGRHAIPSALVASGLEQGLRELPGMIALVDAAWRPACAKALYAAISANYPDFLTKDRRRLEKMLARKKILPDFECYLGRYHVDSQESVEGQVYDLNNLYRLLADYECRM